MSSTKRLLCSATGLLLSAGPGVAVTQGHPLSLVGARQLQDGDGRGRDRCTDVTDPLPDAGTDKADWLYDYFWRVEHCWARPLPRRRWRHHGSTTVVTVPPTTVAPTTTAAPAPTTTTTVAPTTTTTAAPNTDPTVEGVISNLTAGATLTITDPDNPDRGFVSEFKIANPGKAAQAITVTIMANTPAGFPKFFEAADYDAHVFTCKNSVGAPYYKTVTLAGTFTCTGSLPAGAASVITVSSGSLIAATAVGQIVNVAATVSPGTGNRMLQGVFA
jgi:hypothetical protein